MLDKKNTNIWVISRNLPLLEISKEEEKISQLLGNKQSIQFKQSRGYIRKVLSKLFNLSPLEVPLKATYGKPPELAKDYGYLSLSHCKDIILIGWSKAKIGIDIERKDRNILSKKIANRFFNSYENEILNQFKYQEYDFQVLKRWVIKESLIKWQRGKISFDLEKWSFDNNLNNARHPEFSNEVNIFFRKYKNWIISIATQEKLIENENLSLFFHF